jgi:phosphatidylserine decarboxylase
MVLVGATIVGSMATVWHGVVNPPRPGHLREWRYEDQDLRYRRRATRWAASCSARPW